MLRKLTSLIVCFSLFLTQAGLAEVGQTLNLSNYLNSSPRTLSPLGFQPPVLRYFSYDVGQDNFQLLLDPQDLKDKLSEDQTKGLAQEQLDYFMVGLTLPNSKFWVNLRPDAPDNIIEPELEQTEVGRIMLESDLQLKKDTSSFTSPQSPEGRVYWDKLYVKARELFGQEPANIPTITRPWIVPGEILIREDHVAAYVYKATLKVMLEEDYLTSPQSTVHSPQYSFKDSRMKELNSYSSQLIRELILPKLTQEVNSGKNYAQLRQVYFSLVLSRWFKMRFAGKTSQTSLTQLIDRSDLTGLTSKQPWSKEAYFKEYQKSFAQGEYNLKEEVFTPTGQVIRSYVSGGVNVTSSPLIINSFKKIRNLFKNQEGNSESNSLFLLSIAAVVFGGLIFLLVHGPIKHLPPSPHEFLIVEIPRTFEETKAQLEDVLQKADETEKEFSIYVSRNINGYLLKLLKEQKDVFTTNYTLHLLIKREILSTLSWQLNYITKLLAEADNKPSVLKHEGPWHKPDPLLPFLDPSEEELRKEAGSLKEFWELEIASIGKLEKGIRELSGQPEDIAGWKKDILRFIDWQISRLSHFLHDHGKQRKKYGQTLSEIRNKWDAEENKLNSLDKIKIFLDTSLNNLKDMYSQFEGEDWRAYQLGMRALIEQSILDFQREIEDISNALVTPLDIRKGEPLKSQETVPKVLKIDGGYLRPPLPPVSPKSVSALTEEQLTANNPTALGGIDFTDLEKYLQYDGNFKGIDLSLPLLSKKELESLDLEQEEQTLRNYLTTGFNPNGDRLKRLLAGLFQKDEFSSQQLDLLRLSQNLCNFLSARGLETTPDQRAFILITETGLFLKQGAGKASIKPSLN